MARDYFRQWYDDGDTPEEHNTNDPDQLEFIDGCIILKIDSIAETTLECWEKQQVVLHSIGELPKALCMCEKCKTLLAVCERIRDCLDVGGEQSRQFADELAYLKTAIKEARQ